MSLKHVCEASFGITEPSRSWLSHQCDSDFQKLEIDLTSLSKKISKLGSDLYNCGISLTYKEVDSWSNKIALLLAECTKWKQPCSNREKALVAASKLAYLLMNRSPLPFRFWSALSAESQAFLHQSHRGGFFERPDLLYPIQNGFYPDQTSFVPGFVDFGDGYVFKIEPPQLREEGYFFPLSNYPDHGVLRPRRVAPFDPSDKSLPFFYQGLQKRILEAPHRTQKEQLSGQMALLANINHRHALSACYEVSLPERVSSFGAWAIFKKTLKCESMEGNPYGFINPASENPLTTPLRFQPWTDLKSHKIKFCQVLKEEGLLTLPDLLSLSDDCIMLVQLAHAAPVSLTKEAGITQKDLILLEKLRANTYGKAPITLRGIQPQLNLNKLNEAQNLILAAITFTYFMPSLYETLPPEVRPLFKYNEGEIHRRWIADLRRLPSIIQESINYLKTFKHNDSRSLLDAVGMNLISISITPINIPLPHRLELLRIAFELYPEEEAQIHKTLHHFLHANGKEIRI